MSERAREGKRQRASERERERERERGIERDKFWGGGECHRERAREGEKVYLDFDFTSRLGKERGGGGI